MPSENWFVHEAGWHLLDGNVILDPPAEEAGDPTGCSTKEFSERMEQPTDPPGLFWHPRAWDIHFFVDQDAAGGVDLTQLPYVAIADPVLERYPVGSLDLPELGFFYPSFARCQQD